MIGHRSRFRENDDLPLRRGPAVKKKPLITCKIMRSRDAQRNTGEMTLTETAHQLPRLM